MIMKVTYLLGFVSVFLNLNTLHGDRPCLKKSYGQNKIVCVCNADYCDDLTVPPLKPDEYLMFTSTAQGDRFKMQSGMLSSISSSSSRVNRVKRQAGFLNTKYINSTASKSNFNTSSEILSTSPYLHITNSVKSVMLGSSILWGLSSINIMVDPMKRYQSIMGFGGALTDSTLINFRSLVRPAQMNLANSYFTDSGIGYNMLRVPIGATDFSFKFYTYDDSSKPDPDLKKFKLKFPEDTFYRIPAIKEFQELNPNIKLFATAWTAPTWMKYNVTSEGPYLLIRKYYQTWANYYLKYLRAYKEEGVNFWGLTTGNEPTTGLRINKINILGFLPNQLGDFIAYNLGPTLRKSEFSTIKLMTIDDQIFNFPAYIWGIYLANWKAKQYVDGYALHWYLNGYLPYQLLSFTHDIYPNQFILSTEASEGIIGHKVKLGDWNRAQAYALDIIKDMRNWVTGWIDWNMILDMKGGPTYIKNYLDAPIIVNDYIEFYKQPMFYAIGHFSKFVPRNSTRIGLCYPFLSGLDMVGFQKPDGRYVIIILNRRSREKNVTIMNGNGKKMSQIIPPKSINTILFA